QAGDRGRQGRRTRRRGGRLGLRFWFRRRDLLLGCPGRSCRGHARLGRGARGAPREAHGQLISPGDRPEGLTRAGHRTVTGPRCVRVRVNHVSASPRPARSRVAHALKLRTVDVLAVTDLTAHLRRVTLTGSDLADFASVGPTDHVKLFLADPETGLVHLPAGEGGSNPPGGHPIRRDMTPRACRPAGPSGGP